MAASIASAGNVAVHKEPAHRAFPVDTLVLGIHPPGPAQSDSGWTAHAGYSDPGLQSGSIHSASC